MLRVLTAVEENPREQRLLEEVTAAWLCSGHAGSCMWAQKPGRTGLLSSPELEPLWVPGSEGERASSLPQNWSRSGSLAQLCSRKLFPEASQPLRN